VIPQLLELALPEIARRQPGMRDAKVGVVDDLSLEAHDV
jgi:hypothetical protein